MKNKKNMGAMRFCGLAAVFGRLVWPRIGVFKQLMTLFVGMMSAGLALGTTITLTNSDSTSPGSFATAGYWSDQLTPSLDKDYVVAPNANYYLRVYSGTAFAGHSLSLTNGGALIFKTTSTVTVGADASTGLFMDNGWVGQFTGGGTPLAGYVTLNAGGGGFDPQVFAIITVQAPVGGVGMLRVGDMPNDVQHGGTVILAASNTYSGGTTISDGDTLKLSGTGTLGDTSGSLNFSNVNNYGYGILDLNGTSQAVGGLSGGGGKIFNNATSTTNTLTIGTGNTGNGEFQGVITNGAGVLALIKTGTATITLSGTNGYTGGTTIADGTLQTRRIAGPLAGSGKLVLMLASTNGIQPITGSNVFSGQIVVMAGWLAGVTAGSLGTNNITVDPYYNYDSSFAGTPVNGPAVIEPRYDVNSAGTLTLANGGLMALHQNCAFTAGRIEGTSLGSGTHYYAELAANFPNNFMPGGSGAITVQSYGTLPAIGPVILSQPVGLARYIGRTIDLSVSASGSDTVSYQWRQGGINLGDSGNISGSATTNLTITNLITGNGGNYDVVVSDLNGMSTSTVAQVTVELPEDLVGTNLLACNPVAYYRFNDNGDPSTGSAPIYDYAGGFSGTYSNLVLNGYYGISGPLPESGFPGFSDPNWAAQFFNPYGNSRAGVAPWNLNTNTVTITAWINPTSGQQSYAGLVFSRGTGSSGFGYGANTNSATGGFNLGYTWNNDGSTWSWNSGVTAPQNVWSLVALTVTSTNATIYVINNNAIQVSTHVYSHASVPFDGVTTIGADSADGGSGARTFDGEIDDVGIFNHVLSQADLVALYGAASGMTNWEPVILTQPVSNTLYEYQTAQFAVACSGTDPLVYQWLAGSGGVYTNLVDGARTAGSSTATLTISNLIPGGAADYIVVITNVYGAVTSSVATLVVNPVLGPGTNITSAVIQTAGTDWDTPNTWSINGVSQTDGATLLAQEYNSGSGSGSTFVIQAGGAVRTPNQGNPSTPTTATFPGEVLRIEGQGTYDPTFANAGAIRVKGGNPATVNFKKIVLAGGQLYNAANSGYPAIVSGGEVNVISNATVWCDDDSGTTTRALTIASRLTGDAGGGAILYHAYPTYTSLQTNSSASLNISNSQNTYSGAWNVELGTLVGSAANALGTNTITVGAQGALQTTYDINNTNADLILNGRMNLTQNDTFRHVSVNGNQLSTGTHSYAELTNAYPANFPAAWMGVTGALMATNVVGSITVLESGTASYPTNITFSITGGSLLLTWPASHLGWYVQSNSVALSNTNDWFDILGSEMATNLNIIIHQNQTNVFYRLRHP